MGSAESKEKMYCTRYMNGGGPPALSEQVEKSINGTSTFKRSSEVVEGNQPDGGQMTVIVQRRSVEGYPDCDTLQINFVFEDGIQMEKHPKPGHKYEGLSTAAFLPMNNEGTKVFKLLEAAFQHKLLFTVATTSSGEECITYTDIPLKIRERGGPESCGYPDPNYLKTVLKILKSKGIK
ncbi:E3 ubiquitin-protein ligase DTX3L1 isoform X1 [Pygocentrus nattereri]|uniref:E3 ubiquitin-protein ligase DTX3L1 isoform X1 n=2 Tax=Pygocentrus nattereri TaxID=42514 RepID=UPI0008147BA7|nr:E3 ubiquitin-protein ligase DTX3L1 isoform X1 [Pygocentrus nattereri]